MRCEHYGTLPIYRNRILSISVSKQFVLPSKTSFLDMSLYLPLQRLIRFCISRANDVSLPLRSVECVSLGLSDTPIVIVTLKGCKCYLPAGPTVMLRQS